MTNVIFAQITASISELKKNPMATVSSGDGNPVVILNRNQPAFYCVPAKLYEEFMDRLEDIELNSIADSRKNHPVIKVKLDEI